ncbi:MAG: DNRLRE domain-containing protein [Methylococcales bacterium]
MRNLIFIKLLSISVLFLSLSVVCSSVYAQGIDQQDAGKVNFFNNADRHFDRYSKQPGAEQKQWMNTHYDRMLTYAPYFDTRLDWYPDALVYRDSYAIYIDGDVAVEHPEWIMRDARGNKLYIPYACQNGSCPQYAGDFSNPAYRSFRINEFIKIISQGYRGLWLDDVNLTWRVSDGNEKHVAPIDFTTGKPMTLDGWQNHMANFMEEIRAALPDIEISHNVVWYSDRVENENSDIKRQIEAADFINLEYGGNDAGLKNGLGQYGFETFLLFNDYIHDHGANVIMMDGGTTQENREYGLATWLLVSQGKDLFSSNQLEWTTPDNWWQGYDLNLGEALGLRYKWGELIRRDFECGMVVLNQPGLETQTVELDESLTNMDGKLVTSVALDAKTAAILRKPCDVSNPEDDDTPQESSILSFQNGIDGYTGSQETMIDDSAPDQNFNLSSEIEIDGSPRNTGALMSWDISGISSDATVESVEITLYITNKSRQSYEIHAMKRPWDEDQATWNQYASGKSWSEAGAKGTSDRDPTILAKLRGTSQDRYLTVSLNANGIALVQSWINDPSSNYGFLFKDYSVSDGLDFSSSETSQITRRPKLTIKYKEE